MYSATLMDHFERPRNGGKPEVFNAKGVSGDPSAGPFMVLYLNVQGGRIAGVGFQTYGCGPAVAAGSLLTELVKGKSLLEASAITAPILTTGLGGLPLGKGHCADIAIDALNRALSEASQIGKAKEEGSHE